MKGVVVKSTGSWYMVLDDTMTQWQCRIQGKFRLQDKELTNPIAVGDIIQFTPEEGQAGQGTITHIEARSNYIVRQSPRQKHQLHLIASNIDQALIITTIREPALKPGFIDRYLLMTEPQDIPVIIVFNKIDLYDDDANLVLNYFTEIYTSIGYVVLPVSALEGTNINELKSKLIGKTTLVGGQSGVGKSSLVSAMFPNIDLKVGAVSEHSGKGVHTTTFAEMHTLPEGGGLIDTPGIKTLSFNNLTPQDVAHNFREFFELSDNCKFGGSCTHTTEPGCAVIQGIDEGTVYEVRYQNYLAILEEINQQNYWERKKNM